MSRAKNAKKKKESGSPFEALRALKDELRRKEEGERSNKKPGVSLPRPRRTEPAPPPLPQDDALLLHRLFAGVKPLDRSPGRIPKQGVERSLSAERSATASAKAAQADADAVHEHLRTLVEGGTRFEVADDGRHVEGRRLDVPLDAVRRLRRGRMPIDARVDLHGMGVREARAQVEAFLRTTRGRGDRCVLIIHGKGAHSPHGAGVLRGEIAAWLAQGTSSEHVAAFATAGKDDGGEGALYVLLRR